MALQVLVPALAGLLLLEALQHRVESDYQSLSDGGLARPIDFHPDLIVQWDDETNYGRRRPCTRSQRSIRQDRHHSQASVSRPHTNIH
jgi:hypothetical protein